MNVEYIKLNPTENTTLLVKTPVPRPLQGPVAARLLDAVGGEQVGYIEAATLPGAQARLQMMGGEFCGNATMSLGALLARRAGLGEGEALCLTLEVSGCDGPVPCRILPTADGWTGTVGMPLPTSLRRLALGTDAGPMEVDLVEMPGISHLILPASVGLEEAQLRRRLPEWNDRIGADALGALLLDEAAHSIDPLVYVPSAGTLVRERGCGSGSAALGSLLALRAGRSLRTDVKQPGGVIRVDATLEGGRLASLAITGRVALVEEGSAEIPL